MNFQVVADESVDFRIVTALKAAEITIFSIAGEHPSITDKEVLAVAVDKGALLLTEDKDFGELVFRLQLPHRGVLLIRIFDGERKIAITVKAILENYADMLDKFSVISKNRLRIKQ